MKKTRVKKYKISKNKFHIYVFVCCSYRMHICISYRILDQVRRLGRRRDATVLAGVAGSSRQQFYRFVGVRESRRRPANDSERAGRGGRGGTGGALIFCTFFSSNPVGGRGGGTGGTHFSRFFFVFSFCTQGCLGALRKWGAPGRALLLQSLFAWRSSAVFGIYFLFYFCCCLEYWI